MWRRQGRDGRREDSERTDGNWHCVPICGDVITGLIKIAEVGTIRADAGTYRMTPTRDYRGHGWMRR